jgi:hypothetical protein
MENAKRMIINLTLNLQGSIAEIKEWIDEYVPKENIVRCDVTRITRFEKETAHYTQVTGTDTACKNFKKIDLKLNIPIAFDSLGRRLSPTIACAKYIDEFIHSYQYRKANKGTHPGLNETPQVDEKSLAYANWKSNFYLLRR